MSEARIAGVGMTLFTKPGQSEDRDVVAKNAIRQVEGARFGLQPNLGLGGACVVTRYGKVV